MLTFQKLLGADSGCPKELVSEGSCRCSPPGQPWTGNLFRGSIWVTNLPHLLHTCDLLNAALSKTAKLCRLPKSSKTGSAVQHKKSWHRTQKPAKNEKSIPKKVPRFFKQLVFSPCFTPETNQPPPTPFPPKIPFTLDSLASATFSASILGFTILAAP